MCTICLQYLLLRIFAGFGKILPGTFSGISEEVAGYPLDIVKTRMQVQVKPENTYTVLKNIIKNEGVSTKDIGVL